MDFLLIIAVLLILGALLGFSGIWAALRTVAWWLLLAAIVVIAISFFL